MSEITTNKETIRRQYLRAVYVSIALSIFGEAILFIIHGLILFPAGNILYKFMWTIVFCGIGMGASGGAFLVLFVVGRLSGVNALLVCTAFTTLAIGVGCGLLCLNLDRKFHYFGGSENSMLFMTNSLAFASVGGAIIGWLLFTGKGNALLEKIGV